MPRSEEEKARDRAMARKLLLELMPKFVDHFAHLEELTLIRKCLELIADRLESIAIMLGGPKR